MKKHKANFKKTYEAKNFGQYVRYTKPLCDSRYPWNKRIYNQERLWKNVTCRKCLKKKMVLETKADNQQKKIEDLEAKLEWAVELLKAYKTSMDYCYRENLYSTIQFFLKSLEEKEVQGE